MSEAEKIAAGPSDATLRMAKIMGVEWVHKPNWKHTNPQRNPDNG